jgi:hypothetical protein
MWVDSKKESVQDAQKDPFQADGGVHETPLYRVASQGERAGRFAGIRYGIMVENAGCVITLGILST